MGVKSGEKKKSFNELEVEGKTKNRARQEGKYEILEQDRGTQQRYIQSKMGEKEEMLERDRGIIE